MSRFTSGPPRGGRETGDEEIDVAAAGEDSHREAPDADELAAAREIVEEAVVKDEDEPRTRVGAPLTDVSCA